MTPVPGQGPLVVVGVDGSDRSAPVLSWAADYVRATGGRMRAVFAWRLPDLANLVPFRIEADLISVAERRLRTVVGESVRGLPVETVVVEGSPARVLLRAARDADLLVIGSGPDDAGGGRSAVVVQCATSCPCALTVVPTPTGRGAQ